MVANLRSWWNSIGAKVYITILVVVFLPTIVLIVLALSYINRVMFAHIIDIDQQILNESLNRTTNNVEDLINMAQIVRLDSTVHAILESAVPEIDTAAYYWLSSEIAPILYNLQSSTIVGFESVHIKVVDRYGNVYSTWPKQGKMQDMPSTFFSMGHFERAMQSPKPVNWLMFDDDAGTGQIALVQTLVGQAGTEPIGLVVISLTRDSFRDRILGSNYLNTGDSMLVIDADRHIMASLNADQTEHIEDCLALLPASLTQYGYSQLQIGGDKKLISYMPVAINAWTLVKISDYNNIFHELSQLRMMVIVFLIIQFFLATVTICLMTRNIVRPIKNLTALMSMAEGGDLTVRTAPPETTSEITALNNGFNNMLSRIEELLVQTKRQEMERQALQLEVLHAQINPHFLFNSLNTIKWIALMNQVPTVAHLIEDLGHILEMSIRNIEKLICVDGEIQNVVCFLELQQSRINIVIDVGYDIDDSTRSLLIPRMILQPVVENALVHGYPRGRKKQSKIRIGIRVSLEMGLLVFTVRDDGIGIPPADLAQLRREIDGPSHKNNRGHIGLKNVHKRIQLQFGEEYGLDVQSQANEGTTVRIRLPVRKEEVPDEARTDC